MGIYRTNDPTQFDDIDGIVIDESAPPSAISGAAANVAILVGQFQRGPKSLSLPLGSIGEFHEVYGKSSFSGNKQLKNKKFGALRIIRAVAADAAKATLTVDSKLKFDAKYEGEYGNNIEVTVGDVTGDIASVAKVETITCPADVAGSLHLKGVLLQDDAGSVAFWIDVDNAGGTIPAWASAAARAVEVTTITTGMTAANVAIALRAVIDADAKFSAPAPVGAVITVTHNPAGARAIASANGGGATFSFAILTAGVTAVNAGFKVTIEDTNPDAVLPIEIYDGLTAAALTTATFAASRLVDVTILDDSSDPANQAATALAGGDDGTIANGDYEDAIAYAEEEKAGNLLFLDEYNATRNGYLKTHVAAQQDKMCVVCGQPGDDRAAAVADAANYRDSDGRIIYAWPYVQTSIDNVLELTPPAAWVASIFSQTSPHVALSYTGNTGFLAGITDLEYKESRNGYIALNGAGVLALEFDKDVGFLVKNAVTTHILNTEKREVLRRRMADFLTTSIAYYLKNYQNDVNSSAKRDEVKAAILSFDSLLVADKILPGQQDVKGGAPLLVDTESLNTDNVIAQGQFRILYKRRIFSSMRFIVLQAEIGTSVVVTEV
jgi:hypothetical protein